MEELSEKRDWMKQVPEQLKSYTVQSSEMDIFFIHNI